MLLLVNCGDFSHCIYAKNNKFHFLKESRKMVIYGFKIYSGKK